MGCVCACEGGVHAYHTNMVHGHIVVIQCTYTTSTYTTCTHCTHTIQTLCTSQSPHTTHIPRPPAPHSKCADVCDRAAYEAWVQTGLPPPGPPPKTTPVLEQTIEVRWCFIITIIIITTTYTQQHSAVRMVGVMCVPRPNEATAAPRTPSGPASTDQGGPSHPCPDNTLIKSTPPLPLPTHAPMQPPFRPPAMTPRTTHEGGGGLCRAAKNTAGAPGGAPCQPALLQQPWHCRNGRGGTPRCSGQYCRSPFQSPRSCLQRPHPLRHPPSRMPRCWLRNSGCWTCMRG